MKPSEFYGTKDLIYAMRCIFYFEGCFYTRSCPEDLKVRFSLYLLHLGAKDWWKFVTTGYFLAEQVVVTWDRFLEMFHDKYFPLVERERLAQEYLLLRKTKNLVTKITRMLHEKSLFYL